MKLLNIAEAQNSVIGSHDLRIDLEEQLVTRAGRVINLTRTEYALLKFLARHKGRVVTRSRISNHLYGEPDGNSNVVDVYIRYLRTKIDRNFQPPLILTKWGRGYYLKDDGSGQSHAATAAQVDRVFEMEIAVDS